MNEEEKFLFDLQGYLIFKQAISPETLRRMNRYLDERAAADPGLRGGTTNAHLFNPITWSPDFLDLLDNPRVFPCLSELMGETLRLDHDYAIFLAPGHKGMILHGPSQTEPVDPLHYYRYADGRMYSGLTVATYALTDVPEGSGGLAVIPGSHKSNFRVPEDIRLLRRESPMVRQIPVSAGDCVVFTEALIHGTLPWQGPGERRTIFLKYAPGSLSWEKSTYFPEPPNPAGSLLEPLLTPARRHLLGSAAADDYRRNQTS